ncbi:hypothetical protein PoB_001720500 [Plakobranchus ocellatus]|uniref:Uncharacterized protein n=1 Tax=Plakobranchus ocellatus TaxID=259542 RepID=A0AAV3Z808_9GAST|nr:hypothetical protein PoB_001720500 [Plakobranchus ocellatus]
MKVTADMMSFRTKKTSVFPNMYTCSWTRCCLQCAIGLTLLYPTSKSDNLCNKTGLVVLAATERYRAKFSCKNEVYSPLVGPSTTRLVCYHCVSPAPGMRGGGSACFVRRPGNDQCPLLRMGYHVPERYPLAARQACHEYGSKHVAGVPPASSKLGFYLQIKGRHPSARKIEQR